MAIGDVGARGTAVNGSVGITSLAITPTATIAAGDVCVVFVAQRSTAAQISGVVDSKGNAWRSLGLYANQTNGDIQVECWMADVKTPILTTDTITISWNGTVTDVCAAAWEFSVGAGMSLRHSAAAVANEVNGANGFGSVSFSGLPSLQRLYLRVLGKHANTTTAITPSANFTSWGLTLRSRNSLNAAIARAEHRINTSTGETSNPTLAVSGNTAGLFFALEEFVPAPPRRLLMGVGV